MGTKEESSPIRIIKGYSGQLTPGQAKAGPCGACKKPVYTEARPVEYYHTEHVKYFHYSCAAL